MARESPEMNGGWILDPALALPVPHKIAELFRRSQPHREPRCAPTRSREWFRGSLRPPANECVIIRPRFPISAAVKIYVSVTPAGLEVCKGGGLGAGLDCL